ncbi:response regulator transcription factor [Humibacter sp. RRB41]|uniref:response regulator n=1 Tax=Humibacter sp. RRB41 TaxID=2919946 RepID=UPI001FAA334E|nr:response regulator transcription factor [Humibacter sp. RRB41]
MSRAASRNAVVIEDDDGIRSLIRAVLERAGFDVISTTNGLDGIAAVRGCHPLVVTIDIRMPGMDGIEATRRIRAISDALIVVLSASGAERDEAESLESGADMFMVKPFRPRDLQRAVEARLHEHPEV